jgi:hypothetical protein
MSEDMVQLELKLRVADSKYLLEELKKKDKQLQRGSMELYDQERVIKRMAATILKLGGNPDEVSYEYFMVTISLDLMLLLLRVAL